MASYFVNDDLNAILSAVDDPNLDCEETLEAVRKHANEALERIRLANAAITSALGEL
jgi:hypothetical protein